MDRDTVTGQQEFVLVPRKPTFEMLRAAKDAALAEDAAWVWDEMIENYEFSNSKEEIRISAKACSHPSDTQESGS